MFVMSAPKILTFDSHLDKLQESEVSDHSISARSQGGHRAGHRVAKVRTDAVAPLSRIVLKILSRRLTCLSIFAAVMTVPCLQRDVLAGLTVSLYSDSSTTDFAFWGDDQSSSSGPAKPVSDSNPDDKRDSNVAQWLTSPGLIAAGGASVPVIVPVFAAAVAAVVEPPQQAPPERTFCYLRETTPQLQQPAGLELLDPPKQVDGRASR